MPLLGRRGLIGGAVGLLAAGTGAALVADRRVMRHRREGIAAQDAFAAPPADRASFVRADDGTELFVEQHGATDARVTVVLVHGFCLDHHTFVRQTTGLRERFAAADVRIVAYDQRSHGRSGRSPAANATIDQLGADLEKVLDAVAPTGPLVLAGHSMGGMTVMALADRRPDLFGPDGRVRGVLLADTSTGKLAAVTLGLPAGAARISGPLLPLVLRGARRGRPVVERGRARLTDVAWVFVKRLSFGPDVEPALVEFVSAMIARTSIDVIADFYPTLMSHDKLAALKRLDGTPLVVVSGADDVITPPEHSREIADAVAGSTLVSIPAAGHMALLERPDLVIGPLADLVAPAIGWAP
ncbi:alpha/beta fold hydrolase [Jatrophihabitans endophyticus]|uniref:alpha/beta fold hydrolase n=1 Tax=Jatrophihabitans endophyticus TaxID=1206085 RepID=UPI0019E387E0|nr:alpha/beta fold hydrolase [Jatrophihabitans endophyticus]MBE7190378.1 alpha/beta fold hydrolase [Jatrophihabitans endophyticus]